jgi:16S rRNA (cytosine967-C5)-methyltransferase
LSSSAAGPLGAEVRASAARILARVLREHVPADDALANAPDLSDRDAALRAALVLGALRWHHRLRWQAAQLLNRPLPPARAELAALIEVGLLQLQFLRVPEHAAVSATVDAAEGLGAPRARGLVNAVLRRFLRERAPLEARALSDPEALYSHPQWIIAATRRDWPDDWQRILEANNAAGPMWLRVNLLRLTRDAYLERLAAAGIAAQPAARVPSAVLLDAPVPVHALPGFAAGDVSVQDVAAQHAPAHLDLAGGLRVLDACAAPGGKTCHMLEACEGLHVTAVDRDATRLSLVRENLARLGLTATVLAGDATRPEAWWDGRSFDRILLDAPCSALGVIRRHPDIKVLRRPSDVDSAVALQARLLAALWPLLKPGGRLIYATCTFLRCENDTQVGGFLATTPDAERAPRPTAGGGQSLPGDAAGDGFFYACLLKQDVVRSGGVSRTQQG